MIELIVSLKFHHNTLSSVMLISEFKTIIDSLSKTVDEFLNNTLSVFRNLPPHYKNMSTEVCIIQRHSEVEN